MTGPDAACGQAARPLSDERFVTFLRWALPLLGLRWEGFRRVRGQVQKRIARRVRALGLHDLEAYRSVLQVQPEEWCVLDGLCRVTISRFYRDREVWSALVSELLPRLFREARERDPAVVRAWSAGCAAGEEPYTLAIAHRHALRASYPNVHIEVHATDSDDVELARAEAARYPAGCLRELPEAWREQAFELAGAQATLRPTYREDVRLLRHDLRAAPLAGPFDLVLCRNLAFTYFDPRLQREVLSKLRSVLRAGGVLVIGVHELLPPPAAGFVQLRRGLYVATG